MAETAAGAKEPTRFVVAEDDPLMLDAIRLALQTQWPSAVIALAADGNEAIRAIAEPAQTPHVFITDLLMPQREGLETIRHVRKTFPDVRIVAISGGFEVRDTEVQILDMARHFGAQATLRKPFALKDLIAAVRGVMHADE